MIAEILNNISKDNFLAQLILIENISDKYRIEWFNEEKFEAELITILTRYSIKISL